ncbi:MAG TPA: exo-alpha-sialidase [Ignavibacteria bacterium]|nr:exo-alpha-sialidase [Ignavibacteria bacterium]
MYNNLFSQPLFKSTIFTHSTDFSFGQPLNNHVSSIEKLNDGRLACVWVSGWREGSLDNKILISYSTNDGSNWSPAQTAIDTGGVYLVRDPLLFSFRNNLYLFYNLQKDSGSVIAATDSKGYYIFSTNNGTNWSSPTLIDVGKDKPVMPKHKPVILSDSSLAFAYYWRNFSQTQTHCGFLRISKNFDTVSVSGDIMISGKNLVEPVLSKTSSGNLIMFFRSNMDHVFYSFSPDNGNTWSVPVSLNVPNPDGLVDIRKLDNNKFLCAWNNSAYIRDNLMLGIFSDSSFNNLENVITIDRRANSGVSYPHICIAGDTILISYSYVLDEGTENGFRKIASDIRFAKINLNNIPALSYSLPNTYTKLSENQSLRNFSFKNSSTGFVAANIFDVNKSVLYKTTDSGINWQLVVMDNSIIDVNCVTYSDSLNIFAWGSSGHYFKSTNDGLNWSHLVLGGISNVLDIKFNETNGILCGSAGTVFYSTNSGNNWTNTTTGVSINLRNIYFYDSTNVFICCDSGYVLRSTNVGVNWTKLNNQIYKDLYSVKSHDSDVYICGDSGVFLKSTNAGNNWSQLNIGTDKNLRDISFDSSGNVYLISDQNNIYWSMLPDMIIWNEKILNQIHNFSNAIVLNNHLLISGWDGRIYNIELNEILPVEISSFNSLLNGNEVTLNWITEKEVNSSKFIVERKKENVDYINTGEVKSKSSSGRNEYTFKDKLFEPGLYYYRLKQIDINGDYTFHYLQSYINLSTPEKFILHQNYPNPFNNSTKIKFEIPFSSEVKLKIFDITGREIKTIESGILAGGYYERNINLEVLSSGIYFYSLYVKTPDNTTVFFKKMAIIK